MMGMRKNVSIPFTNMLGKGARVLSMAGHRADERIPVASLSDRKVMGKLGVPVGECVEVRATIVSSEGP